ncbi:MAG: hypothetical protein GY841_15495 [FCB group bacterium]|nr:hypothetical protein [FCB group bacterium]
MSAKKMLNIRTINVKTNFDKALKKLNFSKCSVAKRAGMPSGSLGSVLLHNNPTMRQLYKISCGIGVSIRYLMEGGDVEEELKKNYIFEAMCEPQLKKGWEPKKPNVSARVQMILREKGIRKLEAAHRINALPSWWSPILKMNNPTILVLERIAYALEVKPFELVDPVSPVDYAEIIMPPISF